jgi:hypothetical protein
MSRKELGIVVVLKGGGDGSDVVEGVGGQRGKSPGELRAGGKEKWAARTMGDGGRAERREKREGKAGENDAHRRETILHWLCLRRNARKCSK